MQPEIAFHWQLCVMPDRVSTVAIARLAAFRKLWCVEAQKEVDWGKKSA
jgi:hypothetical protein